MTTITKTEIPNGINTVERLAVYSLLALARVNPDLRVIEVAGLSQKAVETTIMPADDGTIRLIARVSIALNPDYVTDTTQPLYMKALDLSNTLLPAAFKQA